MTCSHEQFESKKEKNTHIQLYTSRTKNRRSGKEAHTACGYRSRATVIDRPSNMETLSLFFIPLFFFSRPLSLSFRPCQSTGNKCMMHARVYPSAAGCANSVHFYIIIFRGAQADGLFVDFLPAGVNVFVPEKFSSTHTWLFGKIQWHVERRYRWNQSFANSDLTASPYYFMARVYAVGGRKIFKTSTSRIRVSWLARAIGAAG